MINVSSKKIVVIGAGQIGRETACQLAEMGYDIDIIKRSGKNHAASVEQSAAQNIIDQNSLKVYELLRSCKTGKLTFKKYSNSDEFATLLRGANIVAVCVGKTLNSMATTPHPLQGAVENSEIYAHIGKVIAENAADDVKVLSTAIPVEVVANTLYNSIKNNWDSIKRGIDFSADRVGAGGTLLDTVRLKNTALNYINSQENVTQLATEILEVYAIGSHGYGPYSDRYEIGLTASTHAGLIRFGGIKNPNGTYTGGNLIPFDDIINYREKQELMKSAFTQPVHIRDAAGERALHKEAGRSNALVIKAFLEPENFQDTKLPITVFNHDNNMFYGGVCIVSKSGSFKEIAPETYLSSQEQEALNIRMRGIQKANDAVRTIAPGTCLNMIVYYGKYSSLEPAQAIGFI